MSAYYLDLFIVGCLMSSGKYFVGILDEHAFRNYDRRLRNFDLINSKLR